MNYD
jgi:hypothetical protein